MIHELRHSEPVRLDKVRLAEIVARLGPRGADDMVSRAMEELAVQLARVHKNYGRARMGDVVEAAAVVARIAAHVGMPGLSRVARDVGWLARPARSRNNDVALAATVARLVRIGEDSLMQVWDLQDLSGS